MAKKCMNANQNIIKLSSTENWSNICHVATSHHTRRIFMFSFFPLLRHCGDFMGICGDASECDRQNTLCTSYVVSASISHCALNSRWEAMHHFINCSLSTYESIHSENIAFNYFHSLINIVSYSLSSWARAREMEINKEFRCLEGFVIIDHAQRTI